MPISLDPEAEDVNKFWPTQKEHKIPLEGIDLQSLQHCQLLYTYRNSLVHELRIPGHGMEFGDDIEPFYHLASTFGPNQEIEVTSVELVYPWRFLHSLCDRSLESLKEYFIANDLNPYDSFTFGTYWLDELNR